MPKTPSYRQRPGYTQAMVTFTDSATSSLPVRPPRRPAGRRLLPRVSERKVSKLSEVGEDHGIGSQIRTGTSFTI